MRITFPAAWLPAALLAVLAIPGVAAAKFNVEIVKAVGAMHAEGSIDTLLLTLRWAKQADRAAEAATALGQYHTSKQRERILTEVVKHAKAMKPAGDPAAPIPGSAPTRWDVIRGPIAAALDTLTGTTVGDVDAWIKKFDEAKGLLKPLFKD